MDLRTAYDAGRQALTGCRLSFDRFATLATSLHIEADTLAARGPELYLAWAAGHRDPPSLKMLEQTAFTCVRNRLRARGVQGDIADDVMQATREKLLTGSAPRILTFNGSAPLAQWMSVIAIRMHVDQRRKEPRQSVNSVVERIARSALDHSVPALNAEGYSQFRAALRDELLGLDSRTRTIIRLHFVDGATLNAIGRIYAVNRSTIARWLWKASDKIREGMRRRMGDRLGITSSDFDSLGRDLASHLDYHLSAALKSRGASQGD